jgi:hypothetical protein
VENYRYSHTFTDFEDFRLEDELLREEPGK